MISISLGKKNDFSKNKNCFQNVLIVEINSGKTVAINVENDIMNVSYVKRSLKRQIEKTI